MKNDFENLDFNKAEVRFLYDLKNVLFDQVWLKKSENFPIYYIFRGLKKEKGLRYDITIIPPNVLGKEFVKTKGHFHSGNFGELYQVLLGESIFLLQKGKDEVEDVYFVRAKRKDYIAIPSGYGHVIINPKKQVLKIANWVSPHCLSDYESVEKKKGMCYYYTLKGWIKNKHYQNIPEIREERSQLRKPKNFSFLYG